MIILFAFVPVNEFQRKVTNEDGKKLLFTGNIPRGAFVSEGHRKSETYCANLFDQHKFCASRSVLLRTEWTVTVKTSLIISPSSGITSIRWAIFDIPSHSSRFVLPAIVFISSDSSPNFLRNLLISFHSAACPEAVLPPDSSVPVSHLSFPYRCLRRLQKE